MFRMFALWSIPPSSPGSIGREKQAGPQSRFQLLPNTYGSDEGLTSRAGSVDLKRGDKRATSPLFSDGSTSDLVIIAEDLRRPSIISCTHFFLYKYFKRSSQGDVTYLLLEVGLYSGLFRNVGGYLLSIFQSPYQKCDVP